MSTGLTIVIDYTIFFMMFRMTIENTQLFAKCNENRLRVDA